MYYYYIICTLLAESQHCPITCSSMSQTSLTWKWQTTVWVSTDVTCLNVAEKNQDEYKRLMPGCNSLGEYRHLMPGCGSLGEYRRFMPGCGRQQSGRVQAAHAWMRQTTVWVSTEVSCLDAADNSQDEQRHPMPGCGRQQSG